MSHDLDTCVVAAAIVDDFQRPRRLLAARRTHPAELSGWWELPGGKVDGAESPVDALHRELKEELGIGAELGAEISGPADGLWPLRPGLVMRVWWAMIIEGSPEPLQDHDRICWLGPSEWLNVPWLPSDTAVIAHIIDARRSGSVDHTPDST
ncbi:NUDIX domain-containing protein [Actinobacteria bacterium YIM 96077]|uniref:8-oxo-dGTP diphosphatase n=2 Tax=Phytoactinopolyspora halophila TaxID=1981511 RepID=A0A329R0T1_9ACTN|nr:NUDIX domain-containing protein [Actinobacteria bacterium YIM 96077]RAW18205.1 DNA mismatch repair protein MutT [Phytoactinopolyspora halophila]